MLRDAGYVSVAMDECVMIKSGNNSTSAIAIYVDDLLIFLCQKRKLKHCGHYR